MNKCFREFRSFLNPPYLFCFGHLHAHNYISQDCIMLFQAAFNKYISQIDRFIKHACRNGYISEALDIKKTSIERENKLWNKIILNKDNALQELLPGDMFLELPLLRTERFKSSFVNRCLFNFV